METIDLIKFADKFKSDVYRCMFLGIANQYPNPRKGTRFICNHIPAVMASREAELDKTFKDHYHWNSLNFPIELYLQEGRTWNVILKELSNFSKNGTI